MMIERRSDPSERTSFLIFAGMLGLFCAWVLHLPLFPMQDGPMHLYLAKVLGDLLRDNHSPLAHFYAVQHVLPPYSLHYYMLIVLMGFLPAVWAEKVVVCIILICFCCGVRYLAKANGAQGSIFGLFSLAIALNWPLMMGFQNYILSLAVACFALGVWTQMGSNGMRALFVGLCAVAAITHPVPLLLIIGFTAVDLGIRSSVARASSSRALKSERWRDAFAFGAASTLLLYVRAFTDRRRSAEDFHAPESVLTRIHYFFGLHGLDFFGRSGVASRLLQLSLYLILLSCAAFGLSTFLKRRIGEWESPYTWLLVTVLLTMAMPFLPDDLSGSKALVSRLQIVTWIGFMAAASGLPALSKRWRDGLTFLALGSGVLSISLGQVRLAPIGQRILDVDQQLLPFAGRAGLLLSAGADDAAVFNAVTYEPLHWQAAAYFGRTGGALLNTPWMDSTWLPLTAQPALLTKNFTPWTMECYHCLRKQMVDSLEVRVMVLRQTDFIVFVDQTGNATQAMLDEVLKADPEYRWSCEHHDWMWLCRKQ